MHKTMDSLLIGGYWGASTKLAAVGQLAKSMWWQFFFGEVAVGAKMWDVDEVSSITRYSRLPSTMD